MNESEGTTALLPPWRWLAEPDMRDLAVRACRAPGLPKGGLRARLLVAIMLEC